MRNSKFVRYSAVLLGLVVLCTKARNRFCTMCTKECCIVLTRSNPFWGQFWGQICETDSHTHQSNKCAALVSLRNTNTLHHGVLTQETPPRTNDEISLSSKKLYASITSHNPCTSPLSPRETPRFAGVRSLSARCTIPPNTAPKSPLSGDFYFTTKAFT